MKWWNRLFKKKAPREQGQAEDSRVINTFELEQVNPDNKEERERYVKDCLEQMATAQKDLVSLTEEYNAVTSQLKDMDELEALPEDDAEEVMDAASIILNLEQTRAAYKDRRGLLKDSEYAKMESQEEEVEEGIQKIREAERYRKLVQQDLSRLDGERHAYRYRRNEMAAMKVNLKGIATICMTAMGICLVMLMILQVGFDLETWAGYFIAVAATAIALTVIYVKYTDADRELDKVEKADNKLILLQNTVKIRYVNNVNLLDYLYMKYGVENGTQLEKLWRVYLKEKEERRQYAETEEKLEAQRKQLIRTLLQCRVKDPERWVRTCSAIVNPEVRKELRESLLQRRQSLRKQMDYNQQIAQQASENIKEIAKENPIYGQEITELVEQYEKQY